MAWKCYVYKKNENGDLEKMIVDSAEIPKGWTPDPAELEEVKTEDAQAEEAPKVKRAYRKKDK